MSDKFNRSHLEAAGFTSFTPVVELRRNLGTITSEPGAYIMLRELGSMPKFHQENPGGCFKGRNPTLPVETLREMWVENCHTIYIGKADNVSRRLKQFLEFGSGEPIGHWGGRCVWQIEGSENFIIGIRYCTSNEDPRELESELINQFITAFGKLPFAKLKR